MTTYVALLRGVNVGGANKVPMKELKAIFEARGHADVVTYIQSGNVVFTSGAKEPVIAKELVADINATFGFDVPVVIRTRAQLAAVLRANPYLSAKADLSKLYVMFLGAEPTATAIATLDPERGAPDEFTVRGREVFLHLPSGAGRSKLTIDWFEKKLGTVATARNWNTVNKLHALMAG